MRKFITFLIMFICFVIGFTPKAIAENIFKITSANFDTSAAIISLTSTDIHNLPDISDIKVVKLTNPTRVYFDIPNAILTGGKKDWQFKTDGIKEVKISQFASNPDIVRVVIHYEDNFDITKMSFLNVQNGIFIKLKKDIAKNPFMQNTYRDDHSSSNDFYEYTTVSTVAANSNDTIAMIDSAFNNISSALYPQELKLHTKYYIDKISTQNGMVTITGIGSAAIEKPMILSNPMRIAFDLPNTMVNKSLRNKEFNIDSTDSVKIGQFSVNKARIVITTPNVTKYIPVYARDNQSIVFLNTDNTQNLKISGHNAIITGYSNYKIDNLSSAMTLNFDEPIVHGLDRTNSEVIVYLYNTGDFDEDKFKQTFTSTAFSNAKLVKTKKGLKLTIPIEHDSLVTTFLGSDGKSLKIQVKAPRISSSTSVSSGTEIKVPPINMPKGTDGKFKVVIDAGHGGTDVGATRNGVYEKYITLDVAKRVEKLLKAQGYGILMTRSDDTYVSLQDRVAFSEEYSPDIFVSIHVNSSTSTSPNGIETHYYHQESIPLAQEVHSSMISSIKAHDRGTFKSKFYVINHTTAPAILVEIGFLSNTAERGQLCTNDRKEATAKAIVEGINNYFKSLQK